MIPDEAVEAAAKAVRKLRINGHRRVVAVATGLDGEIPYVSVREPTDEECARAALEAAAVYADHEEYKQEWAVA